MKFAIIDIYRKGASDADPPLDSISGMEPGGIEGFIGQVAVQLGKELGIAPTAARALIDFDVRDSVRCRPIGTGPSAVAEAEIRAVAHEVALAIVDSFRDIASERAA